MIHVQPGDVTKEPIFLSDALVYLDHSPSIKRLTCFNDALDPTIWRDNFNPFACAFVNTRSHEVILVRDHLGLAPLYYCYHLGKKLIFAQTIPDILKHLPSTPPLLENQIDMLFSQHKVYSDETFHQGIYRVEPGHLMHFKADGTVVKKAFWQIDPHGPMLHYDDDQDYLDHFSMLMKEAIEFATKNQTNVAAEFSAGLDSSSVYCAAVNSHISPKLYMHVATPGTKSANIYHDRDEKAFIDHYQIDDIQRIGADDFDPISILKEYASWFAGPAPYLFFMFANPLHRAVARGQHPILLSGFGGDQCVSNPVLIRVLMLELMQQGEYRQVWEKLKGRSNLKKALHFAQYTHPVLYQLALSMKRTKLKLNNTFRHKLAYKLNDVHPCERGNYHHTREAEWSLLQGPDSHEVRMRVEYSSIVSKKMGFEYRYPLLYPKLLEFMISIPTTQKRRDGRGRYLIRRYLSQFLPKDMFSTYRKMGGLGIVPSTFDKFQQTFEGGGYADVFKDLPYAHLVRHKSPHIAVRNCIKGFMIKEFTE